MRTFGLIGKVLTHSFSKTYFEKKFVKYGITDAEYQLFELNNITELEGLVAAQPNLVGLNVTIPYKQSVISFLDSISPEAEAIGAVNCIHFTNGKKTGYNTDALGFEQSLQSFISFEQLQKDVSVFVLGTGGSSKAVQYVLRKQNIHFNLVSRTATAGQTIEYANIAQLLSEHNLYINCTPLGMHPNPNQTPPLNFEAVKPTDFVFDLIYNPPFTKLMHLAQTHGATVFNGQQMLNLQAEASWEIWNG